MQAIQIQQIGRVAAKPAEQFSVGDKMLWNFGYTSTVVGVESETKAFITFELQSESGLHTRRLKKSRLVATA